MSVVVTAYCSLLTSQCSLTLAAHAQEGYGTCRVCVCMWGGWLGVGLGVCLLPRAMAKAVAKFVEKGALALIERARAIGRRSMLLSRPQC